jgi:2OG-Fe(II) oxygenase superfamily
MYDAGLLCDWRESARRFQRDKYLISRSFVAWQRSRQWSEKALATARDHSNTIQKRTGGDLGVLRYSVVTGGVIRANWPELFNAYTDPVLREWIKVVTGENEIHVSSHLESAININVLARPGDVYRWHFDAIAYTLLLYLTDSEVEDGGALELYPNLHEPVPSNLCGMRKVTYVPRTGDAVLMDGTCCYHRVAPVLRQHLRISIPMVFPRTAEHSRPADLDSYIYKPAA